MTHEHLKALADVAARLDAKGLADESRRLRTVLAQLERAPREVPASAAAEILAVTPQTVRNWVRGGLLPGRRDRTGHFYVAVDALEPAIRLREVLPDQPVGGIMDEEIDAEIDAVRRERRERRTVSGGRR
ncbi:MAG: helix-turn-helix domain-containing protein [Chloroflexota bacterium]